MKKILSLLSLFAALQSFAQDHSAPKQPEIIGRWDITVDEGYRFCHRKWISLKGSWSMQVIDG